MSPEVLQRQQDRQALLRAMTDALSPANTLGDAAADARAVLELLEEDGARYSYLTHWLAPLWLRQKP